ncbi:RNA polymerase subunit sigma-24 [Paenibacillus sp. PK3_47]|nr:sigma-70 family RNA polymerase sigma factor [Paenibacillus sp. PK3_47]UQZ37327.1 RNA polymerase subunit sigma-24 [Paenibacillus sp. PK3_47]
MTDARLVKQAKKGNKEALLQLIMSEKDIYYRLAYTYMGNSHDAMDAMEDMIVTLYEKIGQLKREEAFRSWSKTILVNSCKSLLKKRNKLVLLEDYTAAERLGTANTPAADSYSSSEQQMDLQEMLQQINAEQREAIQLKYLHDLDHRTIADITGVPVGTVKSRIFQGLKKLRLHLGGDPRA